MDHNPKNELAWIEYAGMPESTFPCQEAVLRILQFGDTIARTRILSCSQTHCLLFTVNKDNIVAIKSGFVSGYVGTGPYIFSYVLQLLDFHGSEIEEYEVSTDLIDRLDKSSLTQSDLDQLDSAHPIQPPRWRDYIFLNHLKLETDGNLWREFPPIIPFAIIDSRIVDLALTFWENPNDKLGIAYRRLEDIVRRRTGLSDHGTKLFSQAFREQLSWNDPDEAERNGKANLFTSAYMAYRNPRAHRELQRNPKELLAEFLLLNHLYLLEKDSIERKDKPRK